MMMSPAPAPASSALAEAVVAFRLPEELIRKHIQEIHQGVLAHSRYIREANFTSIHRGDLEFLFGAYDERFFNGLCLPALERGSRFRLATRMTNAGGKTTRFLSRTGDVSYEIAIACNLLFDGFGDRDRSIRVCGLDRKSTRLNSSHDQISYAVFCLKKKKSKGESAQFSGKPRGGMETI